MALTLTRSYLTGSILCILFYPCTFVCVCRFVQGLLLILHLFPSVASIGLFVGFVILNSVVSILFRPISSCRIDCAIYQSSTLTKSNTSDSILSVNPVLVFRPVAVLIVT
eukprot:1145016_1